MADDQGDSGSGLAQRAKVVTLVVTAAWLSQRRMGEGVGAEVRDAVITLVTERSPRAKFRMIGERPEFADDAAERLLDHAAALSRAAPGADGSFVRFFESHMEMIREFRAGGVPLDAVPEKPYPKEVRESILARTASSDEHSARALDQKARYLRDRGQLEEAATTFTEAIRHAREEGDGTTEGDSELGLFVLVQRSAQHTPGGRRRMLEHARRAAEAYRRVGDRIGERDATVALITVLVDQVDKPNLDAALERLGRLDSDYTRWWRAYATAMHATQLPERISGLRWCVESAQLLDDHADFYGKMCAGKLAFFENREVPLGESDADAFQAAIIAGKVFGDGPTEAAMARLDNLLNKVEQTRKFARSQALQRELSNTYQLAYVAAAKCAEAIRGPEAAVDVVELANSRALLAQTGMHRLWRQLSPQVWEHSRPTAQQRLFGRFSTAPTEHNRGLLLRSFATQREVQRHQENRILAAVPGFTTVTPPMTARAVRELLAEDQRVVVYSGTGSIILIARDGCRVIGRFRTDGLATAARLARERLTDPAASSPAHRDVITLLVTELVTPLIEHTPAGCRLFVLPHRELWQVPLLALDPSLLSIDREVSYVPSLTLLARMLTIPRLSRTIERFVGLGDPDGSLPHARAEIGHAASTFIDSFTLTGEQLEFHAAMANLADADVAHLGCHGVFFPEYPDFSVLHLAGPTEQPELLWYCELARYQLNARLVVLAACHAGTGTTLFGSEYMGFPGAFLAAGARGVLAPLWAVSDASTEALMRHFYLALKRFASPAAALREAQRAMAEDQATAHPYHWAGFQLFGVAPAFSLVEAS